MSAFLLSQKQCRTVITVLDFWSYQTLSTSSVLPCLRFLFPIILSLSLHHPGSPAVSFSHSFHTFLPSSICFLFFPPPPLPLSHFLSHLDISLSLFFFVSFPRSSPPSSPPLSLWWMSLSAGCSSYLLSRGAHTVSLSCPPHLNSSTKETERARGYSGMRGGGRPRLRDPLRQLRLDRRGAAQTFGFSV